MGNSPLLEKGPMMNPHIEIIFEQNLYLMVLRTGNGVRLKRSPVTECTQCRFTVSLSGL